MARATVPSLSELARRNLRLYLDGQLITTSGFGSAGTYEVWGWSSNPLIQSGEWRFELLDVGGNVLASGVVTVT